MEIKINQLWNERYKKQAKKITDYQFEMLYNYYKKLCDKVEMDEQQYSIFDITDLSLGYLENKGILKDFFVEKFSIEAKEIKEIKDEVDSEVEKIINEEEIEAEKSFEKEIKEIKKKTSPEIDIFYKDLIDNLDVVLKSDKLFGYIVLGRSGTGKSLQIIQKVSGKLKNFEWVYFTGHLTPLELYKCIYENNGKLIIFDDVSLWENGLSRKIIRSALWSASGERQIIYASSTSKLKIPKTFSLNENTTFIVIDNELPQNIQESIKTRCSVYHLNLSNEDLIKIMYVIGKQKPKVVDEIKRICFENKSILLNLRMLVKGNEFLKYKPECWKHLLKLEMLQMCDIRIPILKEALKKVFPNEKERILYFIQKTGSSRASFFRLKQKIGVETDEINEF